MLCSRSTQVLTKQDHHALHHHLVGFRVSGPEPNPILGSKPQTLSFCKTCKSQATDALHDMVTSTFHFGDPVLACWTLQNPVALQVPADVRQGLGSGQWLVRLAAIPLQNLIPVALMTQGSASLVDIKSYQTPY